MKSHCLVVCLGLRNPDLLPSWIETAAGAAAMEGTDYSSFLSHSPVVVFLQRFPTLYEVFFPNIESICFGTMQPSFFQSRPFIPFSSLLFFLPCVNRMDGGDPVILHPGSYSPIYAILFLSVRVILLAVTSRQWYTLFFDERAAIGTNRSMAKMLCFWTRVVECLPSSCKKASSGRVDCCCRR